MTSNDRAEALFSRILIYATLALLAFVFAVFLVVSVDIPADTPVDVPQDTTTPSADQTTPIEDVLAKPQYLRVRQRNAGYGRLAA